MRLFSYRQGTQRGVAAMVSTDHAVRLDRVAPELPQTMRGLLSIEDGIERAKEAVQQGQSFAEHVDTFVFEPVVTDPHAIWCLARNFKAHADEIGVEVPRKPMIFHRVAASQTGHQRQIVRPRASDQFDYEGELAIVIGREGRHISRDSALSYVAGYSCYNDGSVRDWQRHSSQIGAGKNFADSGSFGPWLVTPDEVGPIRSQTLLTRVNGEQVQKVGIDEMVFGVEDLLVYFSTICPLLPGDVIVAGTPGGVGLFHVPPRFLEPGDIVEVEITNVGILRNEVVDEAEVL